MHAIRTRHVVLASAVCALALGGCAAPGPSVAAATSGDASGDSAKRVVAWQSANVQTARSVAAQAQTLRASAPTAPDRTDRAPASPAPNTGVCTTMPADRPHCTMPPGARITPDGGDLDGDGIFEEHEPFGPGHKDPRAYDGGRSSGETQCAWLRSQGHAC
ncbi:hypothetical protein [Streptomyces sp. GSL17-111]|uniref:hypothetical protein n=1 Tax=Streptomyces sp. GSL17-111 TaxID=3121596 RepID=UPI0030F40E26